MAGFSFKISSKERHSGAGKIEVPVESDQTSNEDNTKVVQPNVIQPKVFRKYNISPDTKNGANGDQQVISDQPLKK